jgi:hypothetical protein
MIASVRIPPFEPPLVRGVMYTDRSDHGAAVTNFGQYLAPFPNWFVLGPNVKFYQKHGVRTEPLHAAAPSIIRDCAEI